MTHLSPASSARLCPPLPSSSLPESRQGRGKGSQGWALPASPQGADTLLGNLSRTQLQC